MLGLAFATPLKPIALSSRRGRILAARFAHGQRQRLGINTRSLNAMSECQQRGINTRSLNVYRLERDVCVDPTAVVSEHAHIGAGSVIGPFSVIEAGVQLGDNVVVRPHAVVCGETVIGDNCEIHSFSVIGGAPQDRKHNPNEESFLRVGANTIMREHVTINGGTSGGGGMTSIGQNSLILTGAHVGHDCRISDGVVVSNQVQLAGHVSIGPGAVIGGDCSIRQFVNIGRMSMVAGASAVDKHVLPFSLVQGNRAVLIRPNLVGLRRKGVSNKIIRDLANAMQSLQNPIDLTLEETAKQLLNRNPNCKFISELVSFVCNLDTTGTYGSGPKHKKLGLVL